MKHLSQDKGTDYKYKGKGYEAGITFEYSWGGSKKK